MPAFLIPIITSFLEWLAEKGFVIWQKEKAKSDADKAIDKKTQDEAQAIKQAKDDEAFDEAAKKALSRD